MATKGMATKGAEATTTKLVKEVTSEEEKPQMGRSSTPVGMATKEVDGMATKQLFDEKTFKDFRGKDFVFT
eukprot:11414708-Karenia_brevis.AAC.1